MHWSLGTLRNQVSCQLKYQVVFEKHAYMFVVFRCMRRRREKYFLLNW